MVKRPIVIASIGYLIGILWGLYIDLCIIPIFLFLYLFGIILAVINKNVKRYGRLIFKKSFIIFAIFTTLGNLIINYNENKSFYIDNEKVNISAVVLSEAEEKNYYYIYKIKILDGKYKNEKLLLKIKKENIDLNYGDKIFLQGTYKEPEKQRNSFGFNYQRYLKSKGIQGSVISQKVKIENKKYINGVEFFLHNIKLNIENNLKKWLTEENSALMIGIILGDKTYLSEETKENFTNSSLAHLLAVSGAHISYLILGMNLIFKKLKISKKKTYFLSIVLLAGFAIMVGATPSVIRATIMGCMILFGKIIYEKSDIFTSMSVACLIILIQNPYSIWDIGFQLSFLATLGIILFYPIILNQLNKFIKKFNSLKEIISVSISAQILIIPILVCNFNSFSLNFLISNILVSPLFAISIIYGTCTILLGSIWNECGKVLSILLNFDLNILNYISKIIGNFKLVNLQIIRPNLFTILIYYFCLIILKEIYSVVTNKNTWEKLNNLERKEIKFVKFLEKNKKTYFKIIILVLIVIFIIKLLLINIIGQDLRINFIDVGQGDSTLIQTNYNKNILIDGGGSLDKESYNVGKNTLLPYLLNKKILKIDYMIISHFDSDHVGGLLYILENMKVKNVIIGTQFENCENIEEFKKIINKKKIKLNVVKMGDKIIIDKNLYFDILWPNNKKEISENSINNNALVCKLVYKNFSMLFTGDIEEEAEKILINRFKENDRLNSTILKVAHHGSKSSSIEEFVKLVNPKVALIGVGKNNLYGHPNGDVLKRLKNINCKIYRTDQMGEISIEVHTNGSFNIKQHIK